MSDFNPTGIGFLIGCCRQCHGRFFEHCLNRKIDDFGTELSPQILINARAFPLRGRLFLAKMRCCLFRVNK
jgi:hypothetical protein